jgi:hypothetical protein
MLSKLIAPAAMMACCMAPAMADDMPPQMFTQNSLLVMQLDLTKMTANDITGGLSALMDYEAMERQGVDTSFRQMIDGTLGQAMGMYGFIHQSIIASGANKISVVIDMEEGEWGPEPAVRIFMPANDEAAQNALGGFAQNFAMGAGMEFANMTLANKPYVVVYNGPKPTGGAGDRTKATGFNGALGDMPASMLRFALMPTQEIREQAGMMLGMVEDPDAANLIRILLDSDWIGGKMDLGRNAGFALAAKTKDAPKLQQSYQSMLTKLRATAVETTAELREVGELNPGDITPTAAAEVLIKNAQMTMATREIAVVEFTTAEIREMMTLLARIGEQEGQSLPELLMDAIPGIGGMGGGF